MKNHFKGIIQKSQNHGNVVSNNDKNVMEAATVTNDCLTQTMLAKYVFLFHQSLSQKIVSAGLM